MKNQRGIQQSLLVCARLGVGALLLVSAFVVELMAESKSDSEELIFTDWVLICEETQARQDCRMEQSMAVTPGTSEALVLGIQIAGTGAAFGNLSIPREVYLATGLEIRAPPADKLIVSYEFCDAHLCHARFALSEPLLIAFKRGSFAKVRIWRNRSDFIDFPVSLQGFTAGFDYLSEAGQR